VPKEGADWLRGSLLNLKGKRMITLSPEKIHETIWSLAAKHSGKDVKDIKPKSRLVQDLGADSLTVVEFSMELEEELDLTFPEKLLDKQDLTLADVEKAVQELAQTPSAV
jgi:acyl carrier protein